MAAPHEPNPQGDLLVTFAVPQESRPFRQHSGAGPGVRVVETGMGPAQAARALDAALAVGGVAEVWSCGFAGGLRSGLRMGDVVFATMAGPDSPLRRQLRDAGAVEGRFATVARVLVTAAEKRTCHAETGADAVEMESGVILARCGARGLPCAVIRVISDEADEDLPLDFNRFLTADHELRWGRLARALVLAPGTLVALRVFQRRLRQAAERLAGVLAEVLRSRGRPVW